MIKQLRQSGSIGEVRRKGAMALGLFKATVMGKGRGEQLVNSSDRFANNMANPGSVRS